MEKEVLLRCSSICKNFSSTRALIEVNYEIKRGEICGLIGENGSGKSTLCSIIGGVQSQTSGEMYRNGEPYKPTSMIAAQQCGIALVVQEASTLAALNVMSNIFVGNLERFRKHGIVDKNKMVEEANRILDLIGAGEIRAEMPMSMLNFEDRKIVEIARAMYLEPEILIIDETTTALAQKGRRLLYQIIDKMRQENKAVIFISHDLEELESVCNTITVLRDGVLVGRLDGEKISVDAMRPLMVGRELEGHFYRGDWDGQVTDNVVLDVQHITSENGYVKNLSIQLRKGEILGIGGLANSGMHEVGRMAFGLDPYLTGEVTHKPSGTVIKDCLNAIENNIGYISKDRDIESIILNASVKDNITMAALKKIKKGMFITPKSEKDLSRANIKKLSIKCVSEKQLCSQLSGGNKQKVAFAKWLAVDSDIYIMDCPTRGIDIGVKKAMYDLIYVFKQQGKSVIMISEELSELIGMSDRIIIMKDGQITVETMRSPDITDVQLIEHMI